MDYMLYIIAGLVLILLVAGLALRKKKAQKPSVQPNTRRRGNTDAPAAMPKPDISAPAPAQDNKFDHITITQRFMDQQRYDKAIETINRGLTEKPHDSQLSLKLLSIYATLNQTEDFNKVYDAIKQHNDAQSIERADELKALYFEEHSPVAVPEQSEEDKTDFESIEFDLPTSQVDTKAASSDDVIAEDKSLTETQTPNDNRADDQETQNLSPVAESVSDNYGNNDSFDLTLSDLEADLDEPATSDAPVAPADDELLSPADSTASDEDTDISEFDFDFETTDQADTPVSKAPTATSDTDATTQSTLEDDEFVLDFDELAIDADDADADVKASITDTATNETHQSDDDFTLSLDDMDLSDDETDFALEDDTLDREDRLEDHTDFIDFELEEKGLKDGELTDTEDTGVVDSKREKEAAQASSDTAPTTFDDNTLIDDDFDFDTLTDTSATAPVEVTPERSTEKPVETAEDFSSRFAADFDFVKSLDNTQVTLDLAGQYVQLGEYDSAKRLLNEVMAQGNSEQQDHAQTLLDRTA